MKIFVKRLNELINERKITRHKLSKDIGVNKQTVIHWTEGAFEPKISSLHKLAIYFDVSADYLLGLENEEGSKILLQKQHNHND